MKNEKLNKTLKTLSWVLPVVVVTIASPAILIAAWRATTEDVPAKAIYVLASIGGFLGGMAYTFIFGIGEALVKQRWQKRKANQQKTAIQLR